MIIIASLGAASPDTLDIEDLAVESSSVGEEMLDEAGAQLLSNGESEQIAAIHENVQEMAEWRLDLNEARDDALQSLPGLSSIDAARIVAYRERKGRFRSVSELKDAGLSEKTIESILPFITVERRLRVPIRGEIVQRWSRRISRTEAYRRDTTRSRYLGGPDALLTRLKVQLGRHVLLGATLEKDAGEPFLEGERRLDLGHDFAAGYVSLSDLGPLNRLVVGDFSTNIGHGLALGQNAAMGSGARSLRVREAIRPHSSSREYGYFRGLAFETRPLYGLQAAAAFSGRSLDARYDSSSGAWLFTSTGLHRTETERSRRQQAREWVVGWMLAYQRAGFRIAIGGSDTKWLVDGTKVRSVRNLTAYSAWTGSAFGLSTEVSPRDSGLAVSCLAVFEPTPSAHFWVESIYSRPGGQAPHSSIAVDSRGTARQETVWQGGLRLLPSPKWNWSMISTWRRAPSHPMEGETSSLSTSLVWRPVRWIAVRIRFSDRRDESVGSCATGDQALRCATVGHRRSIRLQIDYEHSRALRHRFQVEVSNGSTDGEGYRRGVLLYKDVRWRLNRRLQIDGRILFFEVTDYAARIYAFENDLLYSFSAPVFSGRGRRSYVLVRFAPFDALSLQAKYGVSAYEDVTSVGSGLDATIGPTRTDIRVQIRWKFGR